MVQHILAEGVVKMLPPPILTQDVLAHLAGNGARLAHIGCCNLPHVHAVEDGCGNMAVIVGAGDPNDVAGIYAHVYILIDKL